MTTEQAKATAELLECGLSFRGRMMNVQCKDITPPPYDAYRAGHRHARHACAEIAREADAEIKELRAENKRLWEAATAGRIATQELRDCIHTSCVNPHDGVVDDPDARNDIATLDARLERIDAALAPTNSEGAGQ